MPPPPTVPIVIPPIASFQKENTRNGGSTITSIPPPSNDATATSKSSDDNTASSQRSNEEKTPVTSTSTAFQGLRLRLDSAKANSSSSNTTVSRPPVAQTTRSSITAPPTSRLLRTGETLESFFCLADDTPAAHRDLCQDIAYGSKAEDGAAWLEVLYAACQAAVANPHAGFDLVRLHKRATVKLHITVHSSTNTPESTRLAILLSFARAYAIMGEKEEARKKYQDLQLFGVAEKEASLYLAIAKFEADEGNVDAAREALQSGIQKGAKPVHSLQVELNRLILRKEDMVIPPLRPAAGFVRPATIGAENVHPASATPDVSQTGIALATTSKKGRVLRTLFVAPPVAEEEETISSVAAISSTVPDSVGQENRSTKLPFATPARDLRGDDTTNEHMPSSGDSNDSSHGSDMELTNNMTLENKMPSTAIKSGASALPLKSALKKSVMFADTTKPPPQPPVPSSLSRLRTRKRNIGGALRVQAESADDNSDGNNVDSNSPSSSSNDDEDQQKVAALPVKKPVVPPRGAKKITRTELSYMLTWDPETFRKRKFADATATGEANQTGKTSEATQDRTGGSTLSLREGNEKYRDDVKPTALSYSDSNLAHQTPTPSPEKLAAKKADAAKPGKTGEPSPADSLSSADVCTSKLNPDFIELASEDNMVRVNGSSYAKLGVIGKGGSCKVYRALSKDCLVLAIKKVKLEGKERGSLVDSRTIEMYKNEIALLNSLSGNPSIIRMFDSEVDLNRKAIYLVMEAGEVDLNYVLQQQAKSADSSNRKRPSLNMNFIRLTWQQMLSAVHSIHEERIVHGDLKPANFLFVKGALKLIDFGIAKAIQSEDTTNIYRDSQIGTLNYMSPEAIVGTCNGDGEMKMRLGRPSDIWSLGCILYQMVYGKTPFADYHMLQKLHAITDPSHKIKYPQADEAAIDAMQLCLRRKADERPPIVGDDGLLSDHWFLHSKRLAASDGN